MITQLVPDRIDEVHLIFKVLHESVPHSIISDWLSNFESKDQDNAVSIALSIRYFSTNAIIEILNSAVDRVLKAYSSKQIYVLPVGKTHKSSWHFNYYLGKCKAFMRENRIQIVASQTETKASGVIVLIDDFIGTGKSLNVELNKLKYDGEKVIIAIAAMEKGINLLNKLANRVEVESENTFKQAFHAKSGIFKRSIRNSIRDTAFRYGELLVKESRNIKPLGFENSQSLVLFNHGAPNNSLPIIWSETGDWKPLFPRFFESRVSSTRRYRSNIAYEMSMIRLFKHDLSQILNVLEFNNSYTTKIDFLKYGILKGLGNRMSHVIISRNLGISSREVDQYIHDLAQTLFVDSKTRSLTTHGHRALFDVRRIMRKYSRELNSDPQIFGADDYLPSQFHGVVRSE